MKPENLRTYFFLIILAAISALYFKTLLPFLNAIFISIILVMLFYPAYAFMRNRLKFEKGIASAFSLALIFLLIIIPATFILMVISNEAIGFYQQVLANQNSIFANINSIRDSLSNNRYINIHIESFLGQVDWASQITQLAQYLSNFIVSSIQALFSNTLYSIFTLFIMLYTIYYLFIDGEELLKNVLDRLPFSASLQKKLLERFYQTTRSIIISALIIGIIDGAVGTIIFYIAQVPSPLFWGLMVFLLSIIPAVGANAVLLPIGFIKLFFGPLWQGLFIILSSIIIISFIDYVLRPKLIGKNTSLHPLIILFATLGGLLTLGLVGFVLGPIIAALFIVVWDVFGQEYKKQLKDIKKV